LDFGYFVDDVKSEIGLGLLAPLIEPWALTSRPNVLFLFLKKN